MNEFLVKKNGTILPIRVGIETKKLADVSKKSILPIRVGIEIV